MPATTPARCCETEFGLDAELVRQSCGFDRYLGQSEERACVHRFVDAEQREHELRVTALVGVGLDELASLESATSHDPNLSTDELRVVSTATRHWAAIDKGGVVHRLSWSSEACPLDAMEPVIATMAATPTAGEPTPLPRIELEPGPVAAPPESLLGAAAARDAAIEARSLPLGAPALAETLLRSAAHDQLESFVALFEDRARWGLPDRRQLGARPIADDPGAALRALQHAAARLPADARFHCPKPDRRSAAALARGAAIMWCLWIDPAQLDLIVIALRGAQLGGEAGDELGARLVYLGLFPDAPLAPVAMPGEPPPPPAVSVPPIVCGDPHAIDYPGLCPVEEYVEDDEPDAHDDPSALEQELEGADQDGEELPDELPDERPAVHRGERVQVAPPRD